MLDNFISIHSAIFIISIIIFILIFGFIIAMFFSPKLRGKIMSRQFKSLKYMTDYSKDDMKNVITNLSEVSIDSKSKILNKNKDTLKNIVDNEIDINKDAIKTVVSSIKEGLKDSFYCKYCGESIDSDSKFCKYCGKEQ